MDRVYRHSQYEVYAMLGKSLRILTALVLGTSLGCATTHTSGPAIRDAGDVASEENAITSGTIAKYSKAMDAARTIKPGDVENAWVATCLMRMAQIQATYDEAACIETLRLLDAMLTNLAGSETIPYVIAPEVFVSCAYLDAAAVAAPIDRTLAMAFIEKAGQANTAEGELGDMVRADIACASALAENDLAAALHALAPFSEPYIGLAQSDRHLAHADRVFRLYLGFAPKALAPAAAARSEFFGNPQLAYAARLSEFVAPEAALALVHQMFVSDSVVNMNSKETDALSMAVRVAGNDALSILEGIDNEELREQVEERLVQVLARKGLLEDQALAVKHNVVSNPWFEVAQNEPHSYLAHIESHPYEFKDMSPAFNDALVALLKRNEPDAALAALKYLESPWHTQASIAQNLYETEPDRATVLFEESWTAILREPNAVLSVCEKYAEVNPARAAGIIEVMMDGIIGVLAQDYRDYEAKGEDPAPLMTEKTDLPAYGHFKTYIEAYAKLDPAQAVRKYKELAGVYVSGGYHPGVFLHATAPRWQFVVREDPDYFGSIHELIMAAWPDNQRTARDFVHIWLPLNEERTRYFASFVNEPENTSAFGHIPRGMDFASGLSLEHEIKEWKCVRALLKDPHDTSPLEELTTESGFEDYSHPYYPPRRVMSRMAALDPEKAFEAALSAPGWELRDHCLERLGHDMRDDAWDDRIAPHMTDPGHIVSYYEYRAYQSLIGNEQFEAYRNYIKY